VTEYLSGEVVKPLNLHVNIRHLTSSAISALVKLAMWC